MHNFFFMVFELVLLLVSAQVLYKGLNHNIQNRIDLCRCGLLVHRQVYLLSAKSLKYLAYLICVVVHLAHRVLVQAHQLRLLVDYPIDPVQYSTVYCLVYLNKELPQDVHCCEYVTVLVLIHELTKLILERLILTPQLLHVLLSQVLTSIVVVNVPLKEFTCALLLVNIFYS